MKQILCDMDDISLDNPDANGLNYAFYLKGKFPQFKLTYFIIPGRSTEQWVKELSQISWIKLAMHGYHHDEQEELEGYMLEFMEPFTKLYKGPNWKLIPVELELLQKRGWKLAVKNQIMADIPQWPLTDERAVHGHCWIKGDWQRLESLIEADTEFKFIEEVI